LFRCPFDRRCRQGIYIGDVFFSQPLNFKDQRQRKAGEKEGDPGGDQKGIVVKEIIHWLKRFEEFL
jgi:hypothetical protein